MSFPKRSDLRTFVICQVWAFALFLPFNGSLTIPGNRYVMYWSASMLLVFFTLTTLTGVLLFTSGIMLRRLCPNDYQIAVGWAAAISLFFLAWSLLYTWGFGIFVMMTMSPAALFLLLSAVVLLNKRGLTLEKMRLGLSKAALFMAFLVPLFWLNCLSYPRLDVPTYPALEDVPDRSAGKKLHPAENIYLFVCDEWSYQLTFEQGEPLDAYPNLKEFAREACVFTNGHSPGCHTNQALTRMIYQRTEPFVLNQGQPGFLIDGEFRPCAGMPNIFTQARERGFSTYMVGFLHPYHSLLGDSVDYCYSRSFLTGDRPSLAQLSRFFFQSWCRDFLGPVLSKPLGCHRGAKENYDQLQRNQELLDQTRAILCDKRSRGQFALFHLSVPHAPYIYHGDGTVRDLQETYPKDDTVLMREQIVFVDKILGEFLDELKQRGKYENSLIVFTSDHTFRLDKDLVQTGRNLSHVTLMMRFPGQKTPVRVSEPFSNHNILPLMDRVHDYPEDLYHLDQVIAERPWFYEVPDNEVPLTPVPEINR